MVNEGRSRGREAGAYGEHCEADEEEDEGHQPEPLLRGTLKYFWRYSQGFTIHAYLYRHLLHDVLCQIDCWPL
jgi:hypothetical protein